MRLTIIGATGMLGSALAAEAAAAGHQVLGASRSGRTAHGTGFRADAITGEGIRGAVAGAEAVVYAVNTRRDARAFLVDGLARTLDAAPPDALVVVPGIVGCEALPGGYYRAKVDQERLLAGAGRPGLALRLTQFHELLDLVFATFAARRLSPRAAVPVQPVAVDVAARALLDAIEDVRADPAVTPREVAGPERIRLDEAARGWADARGRRLLPVRIPRAPLGGAARGALCPEPGAALELGPTFARWHGRADRAAAR